MEPLNLILHDTSWKQDFPDEEYQIRPIVRAIVLEEDRLLFAHIERKDVFADLSYSETSGGGLEDGEDDLTGLRRELQEELGIEFEVLTYLGEVTDEYNLIRRKNVNHYYLVRKTNEIPNHLMPDEERFHLTKTSLSFEEAYQNYENIKKDRLGFLLYQREVPVLRKAEEYLKEKKETA